MSRAALRIASEILSGGRDLVTETLEQLSLLDGWDTNQPPDDAGVVIVVRHLPVYKFVPYPDQKTAKAQGKSGRWMRQEEDGTWKTAKLPTNIAWRLA